jgi:hypothetical protein
MDAQMIEKACVEFHNATGGAETQKAAEMVISAFRNSSSPYSLCIYLLEHSSFVFVHFHAIQTLRDALLREWASLTREFIQEMEDYLLQFTMKVASPAMIKKQVYQTIAIICKRGWMVVEGVGDVPYLNRDKLFALLSEFLKSEEIEKKSIAIGLLLSIVVEFSSSSKSFQMNLTWDYHHKCFKSFQVHYLAGVFISSMTLLHQTLSSPSLQTSSLLETSLVCCVEVLDWKFDDGESSMLGYLTNTFKNTSNVWCTPGPAWRSLLVDSNETLQTFVQMYPLVNRSESLKHVVCEALILLASLSGKVFQDAQAKAGYLSRLLSGIFSSFLFYFLSSFFFLLFLLPSLSPFSFCSISCSFFSIYCFS